MLFNECIFHPAGFIVDSVGPFAGGPAFVGTGAGTGFAIWRSGATGRPHRTRSVMEALRKMATRLERQRLEEELGHPINWQNVDIDELRNMGTARNTRRQQGTQVAQTIPVPATGTHSGQNFQQNQATAVWKLCVRSFS